jgi:hypothetical protein
LTAVPALRISGATFADRTRLRIAFVTTSVLPSDVDGPGLSVVPGDCVTGCHSPPGQVTRVRSYVSAG